MKERKSFNFEVKLDDVQDDGRFSGLASTYGNVDLGDDIVEPGAFTKTLAERGTVRPLLWSHKSDKPIGLGTLQDSDGGLVIHGELNLDIQEARDVYSNLRKGIVKGLSIGFETVKKNFKEGIRHLTELKLYEVSLCVFPMNESASVQLVKLFDGEESKAGRRYSAATLTRLTAIQNEIQALLAEEAGVEDDATSASGAATPPPVADSIEPVLHSRLSRQSALIGAINAAGTQRV